MSARRHRPAGAQLRAWLRAVGFTLVLSFIVAWGVGDEGRMFPFVVIGAAALGLGVLYWLFPRGLHFAFGTAAGLAIYASLFVVLGRAQFPEAPGWSRPPAFLLPVLAFLAMAWWRRHALERIAERETVRELDELSHTGTWLLLSAAIGILCFALPINRLAPLGQGLALLAAMASIALLVALSVRDVVRLLVDVSVIMEEIGNRTRHLLVPAAAFLLMYALLVVGFASAYRIADALSLHPLFHGPNGPIRISYSDSLHFSVATLSTVGYGDIQPRDDGVRVLASLEVVAGQLLLLFGVAEILRARRTRREDAASLDRTDRTGHSPPGE
ncbi:potassium channel family protein [Roseomonas sp. AR75]|uniref:potassium channel family protein n=1 Tax=Roseomonas sp. AR75 TaxID=2562311 RepID=UPI0010BFDC8D|nr:potassium channel family protein [Roseomonas sp. AR75]